MEVPGPNPERDDKNRVFKYKVTFEGYEDEADLLGTMQQQLAEQGLLGQELLLVGHATPSTSETDSDRRQTFALSLEDYEAILRYNYGYSPLFYAETAPRQEDSTPTISVYNADKLQLSLNEPNVYMTRDGGPLNEALLAEFDVSDWTG